jgi:subtilisin family serine protease
MAQPSSAESIHDSGVDGGATELAPLTQGPSAGSDFMVDPSTDLWFVELSSQPAARGTSRAQLAQERAAFAAEAAGAGIAYQERRSFDTLFNGLSVRVEPADAGRIAALPGVRAVYPVAEIPLPESSEITPDLATALSMTGADVAQSELGLSGEGIKVAVMDTGIDYQHPDLGGCFGPFSPGEDCRVIAGHDLVGDDFNAADPANQTPMPDNDPMDCNGHGTHVAGIVGADAADESGVTGVAPGVTFGAYRVFGCVGSTFADVMIAAMEMALADGMDVLNMSIGSAFQWPQYPTATASDLLVEQGMVVVASIGNSGANGVYSAGAPGLGEKVIGVASFDNSHINALTFDVNPSGQKVAYLGLGGAPPAPLAGVSDEVVWLGRGCLTENADADPPVPPGGDPYLDDPDGKVALIIRGDCTFDEKYQRAADAGATAVVIHNQLDGLFSGGGVVGRDGIPGVGISRADGLDIRALLDAGETVTFTWTEERINAPNPAGGLISSFSSYGLSPDLALKPDIGAPGGLIRSTYPLALGGYATISGTSMSSPHVAGGVALMLEAHPGIEAADMRDILQNNAEPAVWGGNPGLGFLDNVHRQGAGMLDIPGAVQSTNAVTPGKLALGESESGPATRTLRIRNTSSQPVTYTFGHTPALSTFDSTFAPRFTTGFASVSFSTSQVTVAPGKHANVQVTITANPGLPDRSQYGGYLEISGDNGELTRVPYAGFKGDYQSIQVLVPTAAGFPRMARQVAPGQFDPVGDGETFTMADGDTPFVLAHLEHQSQVLRATVTDADTGRNWHYAFYLTHLPRSSTATSFFAFAFNGMTTNATGSVQFTVPDGTYVLELEVLKALGDPGNDDHWETWTSTTIVIDRP